MRRITLLHKESLKDICTVEAASFTLPWTKEMLAAEFLKSYAFFLGIFDEERLAGFSLNWVLFEEGHVADFAVLPEYRRQGFGGSLLDASLQEMSLRGAAVVHLEVRKSNVSAIALYASRGFARAGIRPRYYTDTGEDALLMQLILETKDNDDIIHHIREDANDSGTQQRC